MGALIADTETEPKTLSELEGTRFILESDDIKGIACLVLFFLVGAFILRILDNSDFLWSK